MTLDRPKKAKTLSSLHEEAQLNIVRTANTLTDALEGLLKPHGITATQYSVLLMLRNAGAAGLSRNEVRRQLLSRMPDATRLLDRMVRAGLVSRTPNQSDRRQVTTRITEKGTQVIDGLDDVVKNETVRHVGQLSEKQTRKLIKLLTIVRGSDQTGLNR
jgi:DNA-binding MarR family transcriptional regulator